MGSLNRQFMWARNTALPISVGLDRAGINRKAFTAHQSLGDALPDGHFEHLAKQITLPEASVPVFRECRMIRHRAVETKATEPPVGQVKMDFFT